MVYNLPRITSEPLVGPLAVEVGSRIIVWDHFYLRAFFVGRIIAIRDDFEAIGENFVHNRGPDMLTVRNRLDLRKCGVLPIHDTVDTVSGRFRTYRLRGNIDPMRYAEFKITFVTPEQKARNKTRRPAHQPEPPIQIELIELQ